MGLVNINLHNVKLDGGLGNDDFDTIKLVKISTWCNKYKQHKAFKKEIDRELMSLAWHLERWWDCCAPQDEKEKWISS